MNIYTYLKNDHQTVDDLFEQILSTKSMDKRKSLFEKVKEELLLHSKTENATFYNALKQHKQTKEMVEHAEEEHEEVEELLDQLSDLSVDSEDWLEQFGELKHAVTHHVKEEEENIFEQAREVLTNDQAKQLAEEMDGLKQEIKSAA